MNILFIFQDASGHSSLNSRSSRLYAASGRQLFVGKKSSGGGSSGKKDPQRQEQDQLLLQERQEPVSPPPRSNTLSALTLTVVTVLKNYSRSRL